jgi:tetratricopeptide (TPR) repeat protein
MKLPILAIACLLVVGLVSSPADGQNYRTPDGHDFSVSLKVDKPTIMLGETTFLSFEVKNLSDTRLSFGDGGDYRNNIGRPESYRVTVVRDDGKSVPQPKVTIGMGGLYGSQHVPVNGSYVRKLFVPHWATFEEPGTYTVTVARTLGIAGTEPSLKRSLAGETLSITTKATTTLTLIKTDNDHLGAVIRDIGARMLAESERDNARDAVQLLEFIKDPRTIEYWIKAVHVYSQDPDADGFHRFAQTPRVLATYNTPEAWAELRSAMKSKSEKVRLDVADAFSSSNNEQALPLLLSMQGDPYWFVRLRVAQRLDKEKNDAATEILLRLLNDQNQEVWESAERALKARDRMPKDFPLRPMSALDCPVRQVEAVKTMQSVGGGTSGASGSGGSFRGGETCDVVLKAFQKELSEQRTANNMLGEAWVLYQIGDSYRDSRRYQQAYDLYQLALPLFRTLKNIDAQRELFFELAGASESLKKYEDALKYLNEELSLVRSSSNKSLRSDEGRILDRMSNVHFSLGDDAAGIDFLLKRLDWEKEDKSDYGQFIALRKLGKAYERIGKKTEALASYERALVLSKSFTDFLSGWHDNDVKELTVDIQRLK